MFGPPPEGPIVPAMTVWQKISGLATAVTDAGGSLLGGLASFLGLDWGASAPEKGITFTIGVIALSAKMAKADGVVVPIEVSTFRKVFAFEPAQEGNVSRVFDLAKQDVAGFVEDQIHAVEKRSANLIRILRSEEYEITAQDTHSDEHQRVSDPSEPVGVGTITEFVPDELRPGNVISHLFPGTSWRGRGRARLRFVLILFPFPEHQPALRADIG